MAVYFRAKSPVFENHYCEIPLIQNLLNWKYDLKKKKKKDLLLPLTEVISNPSLVLKRYS